MVGKSPASERVRSREYAPRLHLSTMIYEGDDSTGGVQGQCVSGRTILGFVGVGNSDVDHATQKVLLGLTLLKTQSCVLSCTDRPRRSRHNRDQSVRAHTADSRRVEVGAGAYQQLVQEWLADLAVTPPGPQPPRHRPKPSSSRRAQ
jgi:hypothetical protein